MCAHLVTLSPRLYELSAAGLIFLAVEVDATRLPVTSPFKLPVTTSIEAASA